MMSITPVNKPNHSDFSLSENYDINTHLLISDEIRLVFQYILLTPTCPLIALLGSVGNLINIICFVKQGFQDSVNVNFVGLAISDIGCLVTLIGVAIGYNPLSQALEKFCNPFELFYYVASWPHLVFGRVTSLITALITLERCLCIIIPLKVKSVITPKRASFTITGIFLVVIVSVIPWYYSNRLAWKFSPVKNATILGLVFTPDREITEAIALSFNHFVIPLVSFMVIIVCTLALVTSLKRKSRWRERTQAVQKGNDISNRERKVVRMVLAISFLFIACYVPMAVIFASMMFIPALAIDGKDYNISIIVGALCLLLESVNSSLNIFIYYNMSSKYKVVLRQLFRLSVEFN